MKPHPLQMRRHIDMLVNRRRAKLRAVPCRREAVDVLRQIPVMNRIGVPLHDVADGDDLFALEGLGVFQGLPDGTAGDVPDGVLGVSG